MDIIRTAIERPIAVIAAVLGVLMFGWVALNSIPIQLIPDTRKPVITIRTNWGGASPLEIEREIINRQEAALKGLQGVERMTSNSRFSSASITLEYVLGTEMAEQLLLVSNRLNQIDGYPTEAGEPSIGTSDSEDNPITWMIINKVGETSRPIQQYRRFIEDVVQERIERVPGVAETNVYGGVDNEVRVVFSPELLARYRITVPDVVNALRGANAAVTAGEVEEGKRAYTVRADGELTTPEEIGAVLLRTDIDPASGRVSRVRVSDIARVEVGYKKREVVLRSLGNPAMAINAVREAGSNVIETMRGVREAVSELNAGPLAAEGLGISFSYDETVYIKGAIALVNQNIVVGGLLAVCILLLFLRSPRATLVIALSIPVSVVGSFVAMAATGRTLNVISLAGIAFAVGMVVDAAIVVLENIYSLRAKGMRRRDAAYLGAKQVWSAIFVSALTTVAVFGPILAMQSEVGQLFRDIAVAISVSVCLSLLVAVTVIPALSAKLLNPDAETALKPMRIPVVDHFAHAFHATCVGLARLAARFRVVALALVVAATAGAALVTWKFLPPLDYLPDGNQDFIFGVVLPPPGYNLATTNEIAERVENATRPLWRPGAYDPNDRFTEANDSGGFGAVLDNLGGLGHTALAMIGLAEAPPDAADRGPPEIANFFFVTRTTTSFVGAKPVDPERTRELLPILQAPVLAEPGTFGFFSQRSIFGRGIGGGRAVELNVQAETLEDALGVAQRAARYVGEVLPFSEGHQMRPKPGLELGAPEIRVKPDPVRLGDNGVTMAELGATIDAYNDGLRVIEMTQGARRVDLTLAGDAQSLTTQGIGDLPVVTREGAILPVRSLADVVVTAGPSEILHIERGRAITLEIKPDTRIPLEEALERLQTGVIDRITAEGVPAGVRMSMTGSADKLSSAWSEMVIDLALAIVIVYLVMAVLFESFIYPLVIMFSVPLATAGGVLGLAALNTITFQALDMLTLLGFVILVGVVVNNAILLVDQTLRHIREDSMTVEDAIVEATGNRIRPIFMSTLTSVFGMLPLVLFPGAGSELYRGLGSVVVGGLALSAVLTLVILPPLISLVTSRKGDASARSLGPANEPGVAVPQAAE